MATTPHRVPINALLDADSPRLNGIDHDHVARLAEQLDALPPILVHRSTMQVIDGMHRLHAARDSDCTTIEVTYFDGSDRDCFLAAVEANIRHGLPLTLADRRASAKKILAAHPEWSDRAIAAKVGLSGKTIGSLRRASTDPSVRSAVRVGLDGRVRTVNLDDGRRNVTDVLTRDAGTSIQRDSGRPDATEEAIGHVLDRLKSAEALLPRGDAFDRDEAGEASAEDQATAREPALNGVGQSARSTAKGAKQRSAEIRPIDLGVVLDSLKRDPTLRYNDEGRAMIRWLEARVIRHEEADLVERIPPHQATRIAAVARACAVNWNAIATLLERRSDPPSPAGNAT